MADKLLAQTGSSIDAVGQRCYRYLLTQPAHARGVLQMMAAWDLQAMARLLPSLMVPVQMQIGMADGTVPPSLADHAMAVLPNATRIDFAYIAGAGPDPVADAADFFHRIGPLASALKDAADPSLDDRLKSALQRYTADGIVALPASAWIWRATATGEQP